MVVKAKCCDMNVRGSQESAKPFGNAFPTAEEFCRQKYIGISTTHDKSAETMEEIANMRNTLTNLSFCFPSDISIRVLKP